MEEATPDNSEDAKKAFLAGLAVNTVYLPALERAEFYQWVEETILRDDFNVSKNQR